MKQKTTFQYPWRYKNSFKLLIDGANYFPAMLHEIKSAQSQIILETYLFKSGEIASHFITELCNAKNRGVNIQLLLDDYGTNALSYHDKKTLQSANIEVVRYNPVNFFRFAHSLKRNHRKLLSIDDRVAFIGGAGISDEFSSQTRGEYWLDTMLKIDGELVLDLTHSFQQIWHTQTKQALIKPSNNMFSPNKESQARLLTSSGSEKNEIIRAILNHIRSSKSRIWLTSPYFITSWKIRRALRAAAKKGIDVRLLFPGPISDHRWVRYGIQRYYQRLLRAKISVYEYQPQFTHAKIILCDNWYSLGSSNLDRWNQFLNLDANVEVYDEKSHHQIVELFEQNFLQSHLITSRQWHARNVIQRTKEWSSGVFIRLLDYIIQKFRR